MMNFTWGDAPAMLVVTFAFDLEELRL